MTELKLFLLGSPLVELGGAELAIGRKRVLALLAHLALSDGNQRRDTLAALLWPEMSQSRARAALTRHLSELKKLLGDGWLLISGESIGLKRDELWLDVEEFRALLAECSEIVPDCLSSLNQAIILYRDDFLAGFSLPNAPGFDEWQFFLADELRRVCVGALDRMARIQLEAGDFQGAISSARRWLSLDSLDEAAHRQLMRFYALSGQRTAALRQYQVCVDLLQAELDVAPDAETVRLYEQVRAGRIGPDQAIGLRTMQADSDAVATNQEDAFDTTVPPFLTEDDWPRREELPVVARERELASLNDALDRAVRGQGNVLFVTGEAGMGKSTLLREFARRAMVQHLDLVVASGNCEAYTGAGDPYLVFREILAMLTGDVEARARSGSIGQEHARRLWRLVPQALQALVENGPDLTGVFVSASRVLDSAQAVEPREAEWLSKLHRLTTEPPAYQRSDVLIQSNLFQQYAEVLQRLARDRPLLLLLDDLQWADVGSIDLLFHLGRRLPENRILIVGAYRPADVTLGRGGERHPLEPVLHEFQRRFGDIRLDLSQADGQALVKALIDSQPNRLGPDFREALYRHTEGHALFTVETLRTIEEQGALARDDDERLVVGAEINWERLPARVEGVIGERLGRLPVDLRQTLKVASVMGEEFIAEVVARVLKIDERDIVRQLSGPLDKQHNLVRSEGTQRVAEQQISRYHFRHNLFQSYLYQNIDDSERSYIHEDVGLALERLYGDQSAEIAVQLARHFREAGLRAKAVDYLQLAGELALMSSALREAAAFFEDALDLLGTLPDTPAQHEQELRLQTALGSTLGALSGYAGVEVEQAFSRARSLGEESERTELSLPALRGLQQTHSNQGQHATARELAREFSDLVQRDPMNSGHVVMARLMAGVTSYWLGDFVAAKAELQETLNLYDPSQDQMLVTTYVYENPAISAANFLAWALLHLGYPDQAVARIDESILLARHLEHRRLEAQSLACAIQIHFMRREELLVQELTDALSACVDEHGIQYFVHQAEAYTGWTRGRIGSRQDAVEAVDQVRVGLASHKAVGTMLLRPLFLNLLAETQECAGQSEAALASLKMALAIVEETDERVFEAEINRLIGEILLKSEGSQEGREVSPQSYFLRAIEVARRQHAKWWELRATVSLARLWRDQGRSAEARRMLAEIYDWFTEGFDTQDLFEAKVLLDELQERSRVPVQTASRTQAFEVADSQLVHRDWGEAPDISIFYGRQAEVETLTGWIVDDKCRLIGVFGMGGIGKTALVTHVAEQIQAEFEVVIWRSLKNAPPLDEVLPNWILVLSDQQRYELPGTVDARISILMEYLLQRRCLLVLDNAEAILQAGQHPGHYREGYEDYGQLLQRLGEGRHQSCLLLTSREKPREFAPLEGARTPVRSLHLSSIDIAAGQAILQDRGLSSDNAGWAALLDRYSGNPLALMLVAETVRDLFSGNVARFLKEEAIIFGGVQDVLTQQFDRLSEVEQELLLWLAIERESVTSNQLRENLVLSLSPGKLLEALRNLHRRSLLERNEDGFRLQNVVMEFLTDHLVEVVSQEVEDFGGKGAPEPARSEHDSSPVPYHSPVSQLNRYALIKAHAKEYVRGSQTRLILKPVAERLQAKLGRAELENRLGELLDALRASDQRGYAGGNILNLLLYLDIKPRAFDFSGLSVWQAYLLGNELQDVNFKRSDLSGTVFAEDHGVVLSVAFSPSGRLLAVGTAGGKIRIVQADDGRLLHQCEGHSGWVWSVAFSPDEEMLASGSTDQTTRLWNVQTGQCLDVLGGHTGSVNSVCFSPSGDTLASASDDQSICLWHVPKPQDTISGRPPITLRGHTAPIYSVSFSYDGLMLASGGDDHSIVLWNRESGQPLRMLSGHTDRIWSLRFSPDGQTLASGSKDQTIRLWDVADSFLADNLQAASSDPCRGILRGHVGWVMDIDFSSDGKMLVSSSEDHTVRLWDVPSGQMTRLFQGHSARVISASFRPDDRTIASGGDDLSVRIWDVRSGHVLRILQGLSYRLKSIDFDPTRMLLASGGDDQFVYFWDVQTGQMLGALQGHTSWVQFVRFSPSGNLIASDSRDLTVRVWDVNSRQCRHILPVHASEGDSVCFNATETILATAAEDHSIRLWDVHTGGCVDDLAGHTDGVMTVCYSPDGNILASGSRDRTVRLWNGKTGDAIRTLQGHQDGIRSVAFSPDGKLLASGSDDQTVRLWDVDTGENIRTIQGHSGWVWSVCFSPNGEYLASGSKDRTVRLWDVGTGGCLNIWQDNAFDVYCVRFSNDSRFLANCSNNAIKIWNIESWEYALTLRPDRPYERMNISGATGLTEAQATALQVLGAVTD